MKTHFLMPLFYAFGGAALLVVFAFVNLISTRTNITPNLLIIPVLIGLLGGFLLGSTKKKWLEKSDALNKSAAELQKNLEEVEASKVLTTNLMRMVENIPLPVYLKDQNHRYLLANGQYEALTGETWPNIQGKTDFDLFPQPVAELFREQDLEIITQKTGKTFEETVPLPGGIITFETFKFPLVNDEGEIYAVGGICTDITNLKAAEDSLNSQQERLNVVLGCINEGVIVTDCDRRILMFNHRAEELTEHPSDLAKESLLEKIYQPKDLVTGQDVSFWREQDGKRVPVQHEEMDVVLRTQMGRAQPVTQKTVILLDRFGQNMGLLILFRLPSQSEKACEETVGREIKASETTEKNLSSTHQQSINIMVMDDDPLVRRTCALMLATQGYETIQAEDGNEAITLYKSLLGTTNPIQAIIMDLTVPGAMGGMEATAKILELDPNARIMVASGYSNDPILANYSDYGFLARVEKPFAVQKLIQSVEDLLIL